MITDELLETANCNHAILFSILISCCYWDC